jgi:hypothetical protein
MADQDNGEAKKDPEPPQVVTKPDDLKALRDSVADAASVSNTLWVTYLGTLFYLLIAVGSVTHKDLFLQSSMTLPFVNVNLPTAGFFFLGPVVFLILHAYVLLHFVILTDKIATLDQVLTTQIANQEMLRRQLPANTFVQFLAGPSEVRDGMIGVFLWLIALVTLVISPVLLLLFFELKFLPYHSELITWVQRIAVGIDLGLLWFLWPRIALRKSVAARIDQTSVGLFLKIQRDWTTGTMWILTFGSPAVLLLIATFPGEDLHLVKIPGTAMLIDGKLNESLLPESLLSSRLMLPKFDAVHQAKLDSKEKLDEAAESIIIQGRQLQGANLKLADLRKANFIGDDLTNADLGSANLTNARLDIANLTNARLDFADLTGANLAGANLTGANLTDVKNLNQVQLDQACGKPKVLPPGLMLDKPCPP